ncbi:conserved hypothetical protein [Parvibaculum lavamentivorans DS-1]|uniref:Metallohydrolase n=1 Tax=Parvibaculum lavamentivorans (strain DS-1 / DSM 13023 / NCIMB 13966) TaxID=402881 RepID=A7HPV9_PARL1|nr:hypothetical protein [Parvibaculum lavamentivorans]ABS61942.1 conserved hypothetical protein [Parvibaculum lavamentivorans DS-1]
MAAKIEFFPVDNGDMALVTLESGRVILIDANIRASADDKNDDEVPDVATMLRDRLPTDSQGRSYIDVFLLTHPDQDHCRGLRKHFHIGPSDDWDESEDKIFIREMWSSPIVFRRKDRIESLCEDAAAWRDEARRRVNLFKNAADPAGIQDGDRILVLGDDIDGKTEGIDDIHVAIDEHFSYICGEEDTSFSSLLLGPLPPSDDEDTEEILAKNRSSVIMQMSIGADGVDNACLLLTCGDAEVAIWERQWELRSGDPSSLEFDILLAPHHCSWHALSYDSWSDNGEDAVLSEDALSALSQAHDNAVIVSSSKAISDDDSDPPCVRAEREYKKIVDSVGGDFYCTMDDGKDSTVLLFEICGDGPAKKSDGGGDGPTNPSAFGPGSISRTEKRGGGRYA